MVQRGTPGAPSFHITGRPGEFEIRAARCKIPLTQFWILDGGQGPRVATTRLFNRSMHVRTFFDNLPVAEEAFEQEEGDNEEQEQEVFELPDFVRSKNHSDVDITVFGPKTTQEWVWIAMCFFHVKQACHNNADLLPNNKDLLPHAFPDATIKSFATGVQKQGDGWRCVYICAWWQIVVMKLIADDSAPRVWQSPPPLPKLWVSLIWKVLHARKLLLEIAWTSLLSPRMCIHSSNRLWHDASRMDASPAACLPDWIAASPSTLRCTRYVLCCVSLHIIILGMLCVCARRNSSWRNALDLRRRYTQCARARRAHARRHCSAAAPIFDLQQPPPR